MYAEYVASQIKPISVSGWYLLCLNKGLNFKCGCGGRVGNLHIGIAGCGPAGLSAALFLNRQGHRVTLVDQLEAPAPVGSGFMLQATGLAVLAELGLGSPIRALGVEIERLHGRAVPSQRTVLDVRFDNLGPGMRGLAVHRAALFDVLFQAVQRAGIEVVTGSCVTSYSCGSDQRPSLQTRSGASIGPFDFVIDALGAGSPLRTQMWPKKRVEALPFGALWTSLEVKAGASLNGFAAHTLEQVYRRADRMAGVMPIGKISKETAPYTAFFWSMKQADVATWEKEGLACWKDEVIGLWPETAELLSQIENHTQMTFAQYGHHTLSQPYRGRVVSIGDAAHATSPQLGQGVNMALLDAYALSEAVAATRDPGEAVVMYAKARRYHVRIYQTLSRAFTPVYQSDSTVLPFLRDWLFAPVAGLPLVPKLIARVVSGTLLPPSIDVRK